VLFLYVMWLSNITIRPITGKHLSKHCPRTKCFQARLAGK
jgi:hypothetical protein